LVEKKKIQRKNIHLSEMKTIRFSPDEIKKIEDDCNLCSEKFSTYARKKILDIPMREKIEIEKIIQIKKIGNNLNQIAKVVNQTKADLNKVQILELLQKIEDQINDS
jgi:hypothetical protein